MGSASVVPPQVARERAGAVRARGVGVAVGPLPEQRTDEALRLAVSLGPAGAGPQMTDRVYRAGPAPEVRLVGVAVVGQHALYRDPPLPVPGERSPQERHRVLAPLGREELGVGEATVVVDGDVKVLPAGTGAAGDAVPQDALAHVPEAAELLGVDVEQLAWALAFVAHHRLPRGTGEPGAPRAAQHLPDGGGGAVDDGAHHLRPAPGALAHGHDLSLRLSGEPPGLKRYR